MRPVSYSVTPCKSLLDWYESAIDIIQASYHWRPRHGAADCWGMCTFTDYTGIMAEWLYPMGSYEIRLNPLLLDTHKVLFV